ncbi:CVNH domain-containing protein [Colletotrichum phormii]|uniref:CVNH domain-containing protein n=2 Tax=Colletotrichum acutatum species complex TaxID=2707335 RepID=A0AAJ0AN27_9PEZI|nr:CVNH domain-containing protein [Colletotrichum godetiae]XP_060437487.1 CVNH domain-containing protein [Colletotrichum phormii]KAK1621492.1 CVNH domain-containing protein [Colletotrichum phormii]KAK1675377.1 CVNH domain-containing protein [Colletotrichum godetiae]
MKTFSIAVAMLASLVAAGDFSKSCTDEHIDPATQVLTANCNAGDGKGTVKSTSLDLNACFTYTGTKIQYSGKGNFGDACNDCYVYRIEDPVYGPIFGTTRVWLSCSCNGSESQIELDTTPVSNKYGTLSCTS